MALIVFSTFRYISSFVIICSVQLILSILLQCTMSQPLVVFFSSILPIVHVLIQFCCFKHKPFEGVSLIWCWLFWMQTYFFPVTRRRHAVLFFPEISSEKNNISKNVCYTIYLFTFFGKGSFFTEINVY